MKRIIISILLFVCINTNTFAEKNKLIQASLWFRYKADINLPKKNKIYFEIEDNSYSPDSELINQQKSDIISAAIDTLPENYREIILLRHEEELDYKTIAEQLDLPLGTVKAHLFRARKLLYEELKDKYNLLNNIK